MRRRRTSICSRVGALGFTVGRGRWAARPIVQATWPQARQTRPPPSPSPCQAAPHCGQLGIWPLREALPWPDRQVKGRGV